MVHGEALPTGERITRRTVLRGGLLGGAALVAGRLAEAAPASASSSATTISIAYSTDWELGPSSVGPYWGGSARAFEKANPQVTVKQVPIPGAYNDIVDKLSLLYRSPFTAPTVACVPIAEVGLWASSDFLAPLDKYVSSAPWWKTFPAPVKAADSYQGHVYAITAGQNTTALWYNKPAFAKAGIPVPWSPKNWQDILSAATKIKASSPGLAPLWALGGTEGGSESSLFGIYNLILGSSTPTVFDTTMERWVIDSPGIRAALGFYLKLKLQGLQADPADLFNPDALSNIAQLMKEQKVGIVLGPNWFGPDWTKSISYPYWPQGPSVYGVTELPNAAGNGFASSSSSWGYVMSAGANKSLAFKYISMMQQEQYAIEHAIDGAFVPVQPQYYANPQFVAAAPPYNEQFAKIVSYATAFPNEVGASVWAAGMNIATGAIIQNGTSVAAAVKLMGSYITQQLGAGKVTTLG